jgi:hypothetical protein
MTESEQPIDLSPELAHNIKDFPKFELSSEERLYLEGVHTKFEEGLDIREFYSFLVDKFGVLVNKEEIDKVCTGENPSDVDPWGKYPNIINNEIYRKKFLIYKIPHHNQIILAKKFDDGEVLLLPDRREKLTEALIGLDEDVDFEGKCKHMMSVKVRGEKLMSVLSPDEMKFFTKMLSGPTIKESYAVTSLRRKIYIKKLDHFFQIIKLPNNNIEDESLGEYCFKIIGLKRGLDLGK